MKITYELWYEDYYEPSCMKSGSLEDIKTYLKENPHIFTTNNCCTYSLKSVVDGPTLEEVVKSL